MKQSNNNQYNINNAILKQPCIKQCNIEIGIYQKVQYQNSATLKSASRTNETITSATESSGTLNSGTIYNAASNSATLNSAASNIVTSKVKL